MPSAVDEMSSLSLSQKYDDAPSAKHIKSALTESLLILTVLFIGCRNICGEGATVYKDKVSVTNHTNHLMMETQCMYCTIVISIFSNS